MRKSVLFQPTLSVLLRDRTFTSIICGVSLLQLLLTVVGFPGWPCPFFHALGIPCPGCGLTRATLFLVRGEWKQALQMHAFAPVLLLGLGLIMLCAIAPRNRVARIADRTEILERSTGLTTLLLSGLVLYWLGRLLILQTAFVRMIQG